MRFGAIMKTNTRNGITQTTVTKYNDYREHVNETTYEERVEIMRVADILIILEEMHKHHALDKGYGVYLDKSSKNGKLYAVKHWTREEQGVS